MWTLRRQQIQVLPSLPSSRLHVRVLRSTSKMPALGRVAAALGVRCCPIWALLLWFSTSILRFPQYVFLFHETTTKFFHSFLTVFCIIYHVQCEATMELAACAHCGWPCNSSTIVKIRCVFDWHMGYNHPCTTYTLIIVDTISVILLKVIWYWLGLSSFCHRDPCITFTFSVHLFAYRAVFFAEYLFIS
jgi:hypothetical protein